MKSDIVLVLGSSGQVSNAIKDLDHEIKNTKEFIFLSRNELDLSFNIKDKFISITNKYKPCLVINAMAYTQVDKAEDEKKIAMQVNGYSMHYISYVCGIKKIPLFHLSTDYVFDGVKSDDWLPSDRVNPLGIYGLSKYFGEELIKSNVLKFNTKALIFRVSWVFSNKGKNFVKTILKVSQKNEEIKIVNDQIGGPTSAKSIAKCLLDITDSAVKDSHPVYGDSKGFPWGIYHFQGEPKVSWFEFGGEIISQALISGLINKSVKITPISTDKYPTPCKRPLNSCFNCESTYSNLGLNMPYWLDDLKLIINDPTLLS